MDNNTYYSIHPSQAEYFNGYGRIIPFRNQYGETFLLAPYKAIAASWFVWMILGILIGRFVL